jgi:hypothetical protein
MKRKPSVKYILQAKNMLLVKYHKRTLVIYMFYFKILKLWIHEHLILLKFPNWGV